MEPYFEGDYPRRITTEKRLLMTVWVLANGDSFRAVGNLFGVPQGKFL